MSLLRFPSQLAAALMVWALCALPSPLCAQNLAETGTVIVVAYNQKRIVVAADSKASFMAEGFQDEVCKVASPARNVLFAASGMVGARDWNASLIARSVATRIVGDNPYLSESTLQSVAQSWAREMAEKIRGLDAESVLRYQRESQTSAMFAGMDRADEIHIVRALLSPVAAANGLDVRINVSILPVPASETRYLVMGRPAVAMEFLENKSGRAQAEVAKWREYFGNSQDLDEDVAIRLVDLTSYFDPRKDLVGGSTSAIRMDGRGGVRWLKRPPSCF